MSRPRPVVNTASVVGIVHSIAVICGFLGFASQETKLNGAALAIGSVVVAVITFGAHIAVALHAQEKVTPGADPRDAQGNQLVSAGTAAVSGAYTTFIHPDSYSDNSGPVTVSSDAGGGYSHFVADSPAFEQFVQPAAADPEPEPPEEAGSAHGALREPEAESTGRHAAPSTTP